MCAHLLSCKLFRSIILIIFSNTSIVTPYLNAIRLCRIYRLIELEIKNIRPVLVSCIPYTVASVLFCFVFRFANIQNSLSIRYANISCEMLVAHFDYLKVLGGLFPPSCATSWIFTQYKLVSLVQCPHPHRILLWLNEFSN